MKRLTFAALIAGLLVLFVAAAAQEKKIDEKKHQQMMQMMQDSTMMNMMMEHIAENDHMRGMMMGKMMEACKSDTSKMMGICKMMMEDEDMHVIMMKMMECGEMKDEMMEKKPDSMQKQDKKEGHEQHHQGQGSETQTSDGGREVLIKFKPDAKTEQIKAMAQDAGMQQVKEIKALNVRVFKITSGKSLEEVIKHCKQEPFVEYAEPNQTYKTQEK